MSDSAPEDLLISAGLTEGTLTVDEASDLLASWGRPKPHQWLARVAEEGRRALDQIREAEDEEAAMFLAMDDLPTAVEQAFSLAPVFAVEHLTLLREFKPERHRDIFRELGVPPPDEVREPGLLTRTRGSERVSSSMTASFLVIAQRTVPVQPTFGPGPTSVVMSARLVRTAG